MSSRRNNPSTATSSTRSDGGLQSRDFPPLTTWRAWNLALRKAGIAGCSLDLVHAGRRVLARSASRCRSSSSLAARRDSRRIGLRTHQSELQAYLMRSANARLDAKGVGE